MSMGKLYMMLFYVAHFMLFSALFFAIIEKKMRLLELKYQKWLYLIFCYFIAMLVIGIASGHDPKFIFRDILPFSFFSCLLIAGDNDKWKIIDKMIYFQFIGVIVLIGIIWKKYGLDISRANMTFLTLSDGSPSLYLAWQQLFAWPYMLLKYRETSLARKLITVVGTSLFFLLGIIFLKRIIILMAGCLILLIFYNKIFYDISFNFHKSFSLKRFFKKMAVLAAIALILLAVTQIIKQVSSITGVSITEIFVDRISGSGGDAIDAALSDDRFSGAGKQVYVQANFMQIFLGQGFGSSLERDGEKIWSVESALGTFFWKGGLFYVILWYYALLNIFLDFLRNKKKSEIIFQILMIISMLLSPVHYFFIINLLTGYSMLYLGRCLNRMGNTNQMHLIGSKLNLTVVEQ